MRDVVIQRTPLLSSRSVTPNWQLAPFDDVRVRQAFSLALDRNALVLEGFSSSPNIPHGAESETIRAYRQPTIHLVLEGPSGYNPDLTDAAGREGKDTLSPDLLAACALVSACAAEKCSGDLAKCPPVSIPIYGHTSESARTFGEAMIAQWRQAFPGWTIVGAGSTGVEVKTFSLSPLTLDGWGADYPDPQDFLSLLWTTHAAYNSGHVNIPQVDGLLAQADGMSGQSGRIPLCQLAEQLLVNEGATIPLYQNLQNYAVRSRVADWSIAPTHVTPRYVRQSAYIKR
jgi:oligopeptide transport system substrate-binding protein